MNFHYRKDGNKFRVWKDTWAGDQFEILDQEEFDWLQRLCNRLSVQIMEADDD